jgi:hypothetical protein
MRTRRERTLSFIAHCEDSFIVAITRHVFFYSGFQKMESPSGVTDEVLGDFYSLVAPPRL